MHPIRNILSRGCGVPSFCTASEPVLEAVMEDAAVHNAAVLIEATANQVNQYGGYTGMKPADFSARMLRMAEACGLSPERLMLGGDHLGPLTWQKEPEQDAMQKAEQLVRDCVLAGFTKIHLDTSMRLGSDPADAPLETVTIAQRGARLAKAAHGAWTERKKAVPDAVEPVYIIGSEVPVPGGAREAGERISVTRPADFAATVDTYRDVFHRHGMEAVWERVAGVVVQPGVEFSDTTVTRYRPDAARALTQRLLQYPQLVFEGHSTDYQTQKSLAEMVRDGVKILKVGPELTFSLREALYALELLERELVSDAKLSCFRRVLDDTMLKNPVYWENYYHGDSCEQERKRSYSYSDRCRYYLGEPDVRSAMEKLLHNLDQADIPLSMLHQYLPAVCDALPDAPLPPVRELAKLYLKTGVIRRYRLAAQEGVPV